MAKQLRCDKVLYCTFVIQSAGERIFKIGEYLAKLQAKWLIVSCTPFTLHFFPQRCWSRQISWIICVLWTETVTNHCRVNRQINISLLSRNIKLLSTSFDLLKVSKRSRLSWLVKEYTLPTSTDSVVRVSASKSTLLIGTTSTGAMTGGNGENGFSRKRVWAHQPILTKFGPPIERTNLEYFEILAVISPQLQKINFRQISEIFLSKMGGEFFTKSIFRICSGRRSP